jgi:hypothetical protein
MLVLKFNLRHATAPQMAFWKMLKIGNDPDRPDLAAFSRLRSTASSRACEKQA